MSKPKLDKPVPLLTVDDVAAWLRRTPTAIRRMVERKSIPYVKVGGRVMFVRADIESWIVKQPAVA